MSLFSELYKHVFIVLDILFAALFPIITRQDAYAVNLTIVVNPFELVF